MKSLPFRVLSELTGTRLQGRRFALRLDLNVPIKNGRVVNDFRVKRVLPVVKHLIRAKARVLILSHHGDRGQSLQPVARLLAQSLPVGFLGPLARLEEVSRLGEGRAMVLENLRRESGEEENDPAFARRLAAGAEFFVNDAFSVSHRRHASIVGLPRLLPSFAGPLFTAEFRELSSLLSPRRPLLVVLGGAKASTKLPLIKKFLKIAEKICIGGALAHPFLKESGFEIGRSLVEKETRSVRPFLKSRKILLPVDVVVEGERGKRICGVDAVDARERIVDLGPETVEVWRPAILQAKTIFWNGPLGNFERGFSQATAELTRFVARSRARSVVGGGDTVTAVDSLEASRKFGFISTAGGAMLDFLTSAGGLPGIRALVRNRSKFRGF